MNGMCMCPGGYLMANGMCLKVGSLGGTCMGNACPGDKMATCQSGMCMCNTNSTGIAGMCMPNGGPGGVCVSGQCPGDRHAVCSSNNIRPPRWDMLERAVCGKDGEMRQGQYVVCLWERLRTLERLLQQKESQVLRNMRS
ncbi:hypothetical protein MAR_024443 [Mya arenaria]|uniref:EB domain-containing protein n=1 Tax=Mya arenaria TaxID=6604 RepID=A0ABY7DYS2_MYAAR|nr:hypothetical protein MAR_024443 [Mya arenaria]